MSEAPLDQVFFTELVQRSFVVPQSATVIADPSPEPLSDGVSFTPSCHGLLGLQLAVGDGRSDQGRNQPVAVELALVAAATVAGAEGLRRDQRPIFAGVGRSSASQARHPK